MVIDRLFIFIIVIFIYSHNDYAHVHIKRNASISIENMSEKRNDKIKLIKPLKQYILMTVGRRYRVITSHENFDRGK